jgi:hypothetical protein
MAAVAPIRAFETVDGVSEGISAFERAMAAVVLGLWIDEA